MRTLQRGGARIAYEVLGKGPAIVFGHSLLGDGATWQMVAPELARDHRVIIIDSRGHRHSIANGSFSLEDLAEDWRAILDHERIDRAVCCGLSMGGMIAMRLALRAPGRVAGLALLGTNAEAERWSLRLQYRAMAEAYRRRLPLDRLLIERLRPLFFGPATIAHRPDLGEAELHRITAMDPHQLYLGIRAVIDRGSVLEHLPALRCPTLILVGEQDRAAPPRCSSRLRSAMPHATLQTIADAGHLLPLEAPAAVLAALRDFIAKLSW